MDHVCNYCRRPAELMCQRCRDRYCSKRCQDVDWPQHKLFCFPMPSLVRPPDEVAFVKSEPVEVLRPPSPSSKFRNMKLVTDNDAISKTSQLGSAEDIPKTSESIVSNSISANIVPSANVNSKPGQQPLPGKEQNIPKTNGSVKDNGILLNNVPSAGVQQEVNSSVKPAYYKTDKVDAALIRKPGTLSQVMPKPVQPPSAQPPKQTIQVPKQDKVDPPKQQKVEPPKQQNVEPPKQQKVELPKQQNVEPPKQQKVEPPQQQKVEPPKQQKVEPPKQQNVEPPKQQKVEPLKQQNIAPKQQNIEPPKKTESELSPVEQLTSGPWMKPFPMDENAVVDITIQYVAPDGTAWVSLTKKENENTILLRKVNKIVSVASTPNPTDIKVNALFLVPFEDIYYRGVVLRPVTSNDTVLIRLVDFGNEVECGIGQLKSALPSVCEANAYAFPIKFKNPRNAEIGNCMKVKKVSTERDVITVIVDGEADVTPNMITMDDIDVVPLPVGANQDLICLDYSNVGSGYVSLCTPDEKAVKFIEDMGLQMSKYCEETKDEYCPQATELCLAKFEDEGWFRALTLKVIEPNKFEIMFIDYGNIATVNSSAIRKMTDDFTHPCLMNACYIKDFPKAPTKDDITKAAIYFNENPAFRADLVEKNDDKYFISVKF
ncbi:hypothetical protein HA402_010694 [Bradysia odoriphaga]|nr:hypothetical protein HA402_010694 [Bradysia odoriphaga]